MFLTPRVADTDATTWKVIFSKVTDEVQFGLLELHGARGVKLPDVTLTSGVLPPLTLTFSPDATAVPPALVNP
jgi:hypothetical protein